MKRLAFTMIELIFVIVVLGILAAVALPKMGGVMNSSIIASGQGDLSAIRASIASARQSELVRGNNSYISKLSTLAGASADGDILFDGNGTSALLMYGVAAEHGWGWKKLTDTSYEFEVDGDVATFTYIPGVGTFDCDHAVEICKKIAE